MKRILIAATALLAFVACTKETSEISAPEDGALQTITVNVAPFGDQTRTAVTPTGGFTWSAGDQIGIYPVASTLGEGQTAQQITFRINEAGDAKSATFNGTGWGLVTNGSYKYFSYYPYSAAAKYNEVAVTFADGLNQVENESTAHLGVNDYLYAPQIQPEDAGAWSFTFKHLSALVEFEITVPEEAKTKVFTEMTVTAPSPLFTTSGKYDPSSATTSAAPEIGANIYSNYLSLTFNGGEGFTPDTDGKIHAYFLIAPAAVNGQKLDVLLITDGDEMYEASKIPESDILSQDYKTYQCIADKKTPTVATNLSVGGTANCYVVPASGTFKFRGTVKGNGVDPITSDADGARIHLNGCHVEVLWETVNTAVAPEVGSIVSNPIIEGNYIIFDATGTPGNALIAIKDCYENIVWSWHVWSTSANLNALAQTYPNDAGVMMDRNLGALSATPGETLTKGLMYQWGRPFPFRGGSSFENNALIKTTNSNIWKTMVTTENVGTLEYSRANPTTFICNNKNENTLSPYNWYWGGNPNLWGETKTMYDPCPVGWKLPKGGDTGIWKTAGFKATTFPYDPDSFGRILSSPEAYYPNLGYLQDAAGSMNIGGWHSNYWSCDAPNDNGYCLGFNITTALSATQVYAKAYGFAVRPCKETE